MMKTTALLLLIVAVAFTGAITPSALAACTPAARLFASMALIDICLALLASTSLDALPRAQDRPLAWCMIAASRLVQQVTRLLGSSPEGRASFKSTSNARHDACALSL